MHKFLFIATLSILWLGCSQTEQTEVPTSVREAFDVHQESAATDALVTDLLASDDKTEEAWGSYFVSREIIRKGVNFEALTYLERAEVLFRSTDNSEGSSRHRRKASGDASSSGRVKVSTTSAAAVVTGTSARTKCPTPSPTAPPT